MKQIRDGRKLNKRRRNDGLKKTETARDSMDDSSVNDDSAVPYTSGSQP